MTTSFDAFSDFRMTGHMTGHMVVLAGSAPTMGARTAKTLAGAGAEVMITDLQDDNAKAPAAQIDAETGRRCRGMACEVTRSADFDTWLVATTKAFGGGIETGDGLHRASAGG